MFANFSYVQSIPPFLVNTHKETIKLQNSDESDEKEQLEKAHNKSLYYHWSKVSFFKPWLIPINQIREYYGEKIAMFMTFLSYYTFSLIPVSILGVPGYVLMLYNEVDDNAYYNAYRIYIGALMIIIVIWSTIVSSKWKQVELNFAVTYGQLDISKGEKTRPGFEGFFQRSIETNKLNVLTFKQEITNRRNFYNWILILIILGIHIVWIGLDIRFINELYESDFPTAGYLELEYLVPIIILYTVFLISEKIFIRLSNAMTKWENYKLRSEFESSFILKNYVYQIVLKLGFPFLISFVI